MLAPSSSWPDLELLANFAAWVDDSHAVSGLGRYHDVSGFSIGYAGEEMATIVIDGMVEWPSTCFISRGNPKKSKRGGL